MNYLVLLGTIIVLISGCQSPRTSPDNPRDLPIVDASATLQIDSTLQTLVDRGDVAGVSALVFEKNQEVYFGAFGYSDIENQVKMDRNTLVKIYSMTKPVTGVALMTLWEEQAFELDDTLAKYLPEFGNMEVYAGMTESGELILEPPRRSITVRDLTRHTAGFLNNNNVPGLSEILQKADTRNRENTLTEIAKKLAGVPLWFHPGEQWEYGLCVDVQALLVERLSGKPFDQYLREQVLDPLGMNQTRYFVPEEDRNRFAAAYNRSDEGKLTRIPDEEAHAFNFNHWPLKPGGFGLTSTLDDYMRFARMLVNHGTLDGVTILDPETIELMSTNHLSDSITERSWLPGKGQVGFGIDFAVRLRPPKSEEENFGVVGEYFWDGAASTLFWVDPVNQLTAVLFVQLFPYDRVGLHHGFRRAVYSSYIENNTPKESQQTP
ncbi:MAG: serine hydrolase [Cyclobacteriaceae bacterium]|nr:MAG: serine hydrolase [Cyclobacteriaceae bacterium]